MKEFVVGIGEIGLEATSFFTKNYNTFPECALILSSKNRLNITGDKGSFIDKASQTGNLIEVDYEKRENDTFFKQKSM